MDQAINHNVNKLIALKEIAEEINQENDMHNMLNIVLNKLLKVTGLTAGWIFLVGQEPIYTFVADKNLPPALRRKNKEAMCQGRCWCLNELWKGRLHNAVNIIECQRIEDARQHGHGDTEGIVHHASVPIISGGETLGLLNVAAPYKQHFTSSELALLQSVAYQVGTAVKRSKLYHQEQKRATYYVKLGEFSHTMGAVLEPSRVPEQAVQKIADSFQFPTVALLIEEGDQWYIRARVLNGSKVSQWIPIPHDQFIPLSRVVREKRIVKLEHVTAQEYVAKGYSDALGSFDSVILTPLLLRGKLEGILWISSPNPYAFDDIDLEITGSLADHIVLVLEVAKLYEQSKELSRMEERTRLARDLHDSVNQTLFSLSLTAKGMESLVDPSDQHKLNVIREIQQLSQDAQLEMRSLIWQLRPEGLDEGVTTALKRYAAKLGINLVETICGVPNLPTFVKEQLWRIGQEALNNIFKHSGVKEARITFSVIERQISMEIADSGSGFQDTEKQSHTGMGLKTMEERAKLIGGMFEVESRPGHGTIIRVLVSLNQCQGS